MESIGTALVILATLSLSPNKIPTGQPKASIKRAKAQVDYSKVELNTFAKPFEAGVKAGDAYAMVRAWLLAQEVGYPAVKRGGLWLLEAAKPQLEEDMKKGTPLAYTFYAMVVQNTREQPVHGNARFLASIPYLKKAADLGEWRAMGHLVDFLMEGTKTDPAIGEAITGSKDPAAWQPYSSNLTAKLMIARESDIGRDDPEAIEDVIGLELLEPGWWKTPAKETWYWKVVARAKELKMPCVYEAEGDYYLSKFGDSQIYDPANETWKGGDVTLMDKAIESYTKGADLGGWRGALKLADEVYQNSLSPRYDLALSRKWTQRALDLIGGKTPKILELLGEDEYD